MTCSVGRINSSLTLTHCGEHALPILRFCAVDCAQIHNTSIVDEDIYLPKLLECLLNCMFDLLRLRNVGLKNQWLRAAFSNQSAFQFSHSIIAPRQQRHTHACTRERSSGGFANEDAPVMTATCPFKLANKSACCSDVDNDFDITRLALLKK